jgi:hypothetical protein
MKKLALGAVAAGALVAATAVPALAQVGVYAGPGGISVGRARRVTTTADGTAHTTTTRRDGAHPYGRYGYHHYYR